MAWNPETVPTISVRKIEGAILDYWVARALGLDAVLTTTSTHEGDLACALPLQERQRNGSIARPADGLCEILLDQRTMRQIGWAWRPSSDYAMGMPAIVGGLVDMIHLPDDGAGEWRSYRRGHSYVEASYLVAGCRAVVASCFGQEVPLVFYDPNTGAVYPVGRRSWEGVLCM